MADTSSGNSALLISFGFPPVAVPEAYLSAKSLSFLPDLKLDVLTADPINPALSLDQSLNEYVGKGFGKVIRLKKPFGWSHRFARRFPDLHKTPDQYRVLIPRAVRAACDYGLNDNGILVTWSTWNSAHLVGLRLKQKFPGLFWLAHFSDPWMGNPYNPLKGKTAKKNQDRQDAVFCAADRLVFTSENAITHAMRHTSEDIFSKSLAIPHPFDPSLYGMNDVEPPQGPMIIRYVGHFYGERKPDGLFFALSLMQKREPDLLDSFQIEIIGRVSDASKHHPVLNSLPPQSIRFLDPVGYLDSLYLMKESDGLLVVDAPAQESIFLPSKLIDYVGAGRPILGLSPQGVTQNVLTQMGYPVAEPNDPEAIYAALKAFLELCRQRKEPQKAEEIRLKYDVRTVRRQYNQCLLERTKWK